MNTERMIKPSSLLSTGMEIREFGDSYLFKFSQPLQERLEELIDKSKVGSLTSDEAIELAGISELSRIFTYINAQLAAKARWSPTNLDSL